MKKYALIVALVVCAVTQASQAKAKKLDWTGVSVLTMVSGGVPVIEDELKVTFTLTTLWFSHPGSFTFFGDTGVNWTITDWLWISPQVGAAGGWMGTEAFTATLQAGTSFFDGLLSSFHMLQFLLMEEAELDIYSYQSLDVSPLSWLAIGCHAETVEELAWFGPHLSLSSGSFRGEVRWQAGGDLKAPALGHEVRFVTSLSF